MCLVLEPVNNIRSVYLEQYAQSLHIRAYYIREVSTKQLQIDNKQLLNNYYINMNNNMNIVTIMIIVL